MASRLSSSMCAACLRAAQRAASSRAPPPPSAALRQSLHTSQRRRIAPLPRPSWSTVHTRTPRRPFATAAAPLSSPQSPQPESPSPSTSPAPARAIQNPRTTSSGDPMHIALSPRAAHRLAAIAASDNNPSLALRVSIESGGCHGFQYLMNLVDLSASPATDEDTVFEGEKGAKVVVDEASLELLNGSTVDYTMELIGSQFKVTGIPGATSSCGCGTSFDIKI